MREPGSGEQRRQSVRQRERGRKQPVAHLRRIRVDASGGVPQHPLIDEPAAEIPHARGDDTALAGHAPHLRNRRDRIGHEIQHQLRRRAGEGANGERQPARLAGDKTRSSGMLARISEIGQGDIDSDRRLALSHCRCKATGAAADIEQHSIRKPRELDHPLAEFARPAPEKHFIGGAVAGAVARSLRHIPQYTWSSEPAAAYDVATAMGGTNGGSARRRRLHLRGQ
jgi:hypothetical protein